MKRRYQLDYASGRPQMYDEKSRKEKAKRIIKTLEVYFGEGKLSKLLLLDIGASTGIIDKILANYFKEVVGTDIDKEAIKFAREHTKKPNLSFRVEDAMKLKFRDKSFDVIVCTHVYEHVPNEKKLFSEIYRVLKPKGVCYLAAQNKLWPWEPHHNLLFLSWLPKKIAGLYLRITRGEREYYEHLLTYWGLKKITRKFVVHEYTDKIFLAPQKFGYKLPSFAKFASPLAKYLAPTLFWILEKK